LVAGPVVAIVTVLVALLATHAAGVSFRDPDHMVGRRLVWVGCLVVVLVGLDVVVRAGRRSRKLMPSLAAMRSVRRERWTPRRGAAVGIALVSFYVTYLAYRDLKSLVPLLRPAVNFDHQLADFDRSLFGGHDPGTLLHSLLGIGVQTQVLSFVYMAFIFFVPISLALALVFSPRPQGGIFYAVALSINWGLGAASYFLLPAMGPIYIAREDFADLPASEASHLQDVLLDQRFEFLRDPTAADAHQSIAAFGSLHTSIIFTAAVAAHMLGLGRLLRIGLWVFFALTAIATIYLGWHYVVDDVAGIVIGLVALVLARALTGFEPRSAQRLPIQEGDGIAVRAAAAQPGHPDHAYPALDAPFVETTSGSHAP
jgi:membrane-associated phospholipid phosphatase